MKPGWKIELLICTTGFIEEHTGPTPQGESIYRNRNVLVRRSQRAQIRWERLIPVFNRWIPDPRVLHPYPDARFAATYPSWKPYA